MTVRLLTGNAAAAWGARMADVDYIPAFPITPQTEIIETLGAWTDNGDLDGRMVTMDSEHSMMAAAGAVLLTALIAVCVGLMVLGPPLLDKVVGWRIP